MARLNRETFGRRGPTNVIAFPVDVGGGGEGSWTPLPSPEPPPPTPYGRVEREFEGRAKELSSPAPPRNHVPPPVLGEVVISLETTQRQARESGWPLEELFSFYVIHGILHLLGYHHDTPEADAAMEAKSWELMAIIGGEESPMEPGTTPG